MAAVGAAFNSQNRFSGYPIVSLPVMDTWSPRSCTGVGRGDTNQDLAPTGPMAYPADRPTSALGARGVQITEYKDAKVNPEPVPLDETDLLLEEHLSACKLRDLTGEDNLEVVKYLELKVDTQETSLGNFGAHLPNMTQLKLSNSIITSVRDLGSSLDHLSVLWMARCGLEDIDGVASMTNLKELYLAYNEVFDVSPCSMLENLSILDLEGNNIDDISQIEFLALCHNLMNLTLEGNPVCLTPCPDETSVDYDYRHAVKSRMPQLRYLDDEPLLGETSSPRRVASVFDDDWRLIEELMEDGMLAGATKEPISNIGRPGSAIRPVTGYRPGSALKQQSPCTPTPLHTGTLATRPASSGGRPGSAARPSSGRPSSAARPSSRGGTAEDNEDTVDDASDLTLGGVVCGNPSKALKNRRQLLMTGENSEKLTKLFDQHAKNPNATPMYQQAPEPIPQEVSNDMTELLEELKEWKMAHQERQKELDLEHAPQILRIDHDDAVSLSGDESVDSDLDEPEPSPVIRRTASNPAPPQSPGGLRPRSGAGFTHARRYQPVTRPTSETGGYVDRPETPSARRRRLQYDDSFEARDDLPVSPESLELRLGFNVGTTRSIKAAAIEDSRVSVSPALRSGKVRFGPIIDRNLIHGSLRSPEHRSPDGSRSSGSGSRSGGSWSGGSAGSLTNSPTTRSTLRGQLARVPLLPSKMSSKTRPAKS